MRTFVLGIRSGWFFVYEVQSFSNDPPGTARMRQATAGHPDMSGAISEAAQYLPPGFTFTLPLQVTPL